MKVIAKVEKVYRFKKKRLMFQNTCNSFTIQIKHIFCQEFHKNCSLVLYIVLTFNFLKFTWGVVA